MGPCLADLLFEGETIQEEIDVSRGTVAVTTHRVLALTGEEDDRRLAHADLPNVRDAQVRTTGRADYLAWAARSGVVGVVLLGGGVLLRTNAMVGTLTDVRAADSPAMAGVGDLVSTVASWLSMLNVLLALVGVLLALAALGLVALYLDTRDRELVIEVADRDPIRLPVDEEEGNRVVSRLQAVL